MKIFFASAFILIGISCTKGKQANEVQEPEIPLRCGVLLTTPVLDSFVYPTYYITAVVQFPGNSETIHYHDNVTGDHDGSWYLPKYGKDSTICIKPN